MPRLTPKLASGVKEAAQSSGFTALEPGAYRARLTKVDAKTASTGNPMWTWEFEVIEEPYKGRKQWNNTVLTDKALWKVAESFSAFGVPEETDTDELIGCTVVLEVSQRTIPTGARAGQLGDNIDRVVPDMDPAAIRHPESAHEGGAAMSGGRQVVTEADAEGRF